MRSFPAGLTALLRKLRHEFLAIHWVERVMLYGSFAKGSWGAQSDVDLAVFVRRGTPCDLAHYMALARLCRSPDFDTQVQLFSAEELDDPCGIVEEVVAHGVDLNALDL